MDFAELGAFLREERLKQNISLDEIKDKTKISNYVLQAIEDGEREKLPADVYARSFIKSYAKVIGLDFEEVRGALDGLFPQDLTGLSGYESRSKGKSLSKVLSFILRR